MRIIFQPLFEILDSIHPLNISGLLSQGQLESQRLLKGQRPQGDQEQLEGQRPQGGREQQLQGGRERQGQQKAQEGDQRVQGGQT